MRLLTSNNIKHTTPLFLLLLLRLYSKVPGFEGLLEKIFLNQPEKWKEVLESNSPAKEIAQLTSPITADPFMLLCVVRSIRPDILVPEIQVVPTFLMFACLIKLYPHPIRNQTAINLQPIGNQSATYPLLVFFKNLNSFF